MKKEIKKIALSGATALAFGGLGIGTTFALFTNEAQTKINIESGIVAVDQSFNILSVYEHDNVQVSPDAQGAYKNSIGGMTYYDASEGALKLEKWCPGDKAVLELQNVNNSNVAIKTKFGLSHESTSNPDLFDALDISYEFTAGYSDAITEENYMEWTKVEVPAGENKVLSTITVTIEFPDSDDGEYNADSEDNAYQDKNCSILFWQQAIQGNAHTPDTSKGYADSYEEEIGGVTYEVNELNEPEHFEQMLSDLAEVDPTDAEAVEEAQKTIFKLADDIDMEGSGDINQGILYGALDGQGHTISNIEYETSEPAAGLFAKYYSGAKVENLIIEDVEIKGTENVGVLFGQSYPHASGTSTTVPDTELTIENVTIGDNVTISGTKGLGGLAGSARWIEKLTIRNCVNNADVNAEVYNAGGFFGTLAGVKTLVMENCVNNGNIRGTHNVAGFIGQAPALENVTVTNCVNHGRIIDFASHGNEANAGWFLACHANNATLNYSGNYTDGAVYYVNANASKIKVFEKDLVGDTAEAGIRVDAGKTYEDYYILDNTVLLSYTIDSGNQFVVNPVTDAVKYVMTMQVWGRDVRLEGNTATVYKEKYLAFSQEFTDLNDLHDQFGRITRAGYFLDSQYTQYDFDATGGISNSSTINGRANFFRLPFANKGNYSVFNMPWYDESIGEWVFILDGQLDCLPGTGHILSPKNTYVTYIITAYDSGNHVIANAVHKDDAAGLNPADPNDVSGSFLKNMAGEEFNSAGPNTVWGDKVYDPVA